MEDVIFTSLVLAVGAAVLVVVRRMSTAQESNLITLGFFAHLGAGFGQVLVYRYYYVEGGDLITYHMLGVPGAEALGYDFTGLFPELVKAFFQQEHRLPFEMWGGGPTGTMMAIAILMLFFLGNSLFAVSVTVAVLSFASKFVIYRALRAEFSAAFHGSLLAAMMLVPTGVFWTSTLLKEPVVMVFLGPLFLGLHWLLQGRRLVAATVLMGVGGGGVLLLKPYVLVSVVIAGGVWIVWARVIRQRGSILVKPAYFAAAALVVLIGLSAAGRVFPRLAPESLADSMTQQRRAAALEEGGSTFYLEDPTASPTAATGNSLAAQLALSPLALVTALFRPFLFEARNLVQLANAFETTWILLLTIQVFRRNALQQLARRVTSSPTLMFCLTLTFVLALGTGLSTGNLGSLSRYRAPMIPFLVSLLLVLRRPEHGGATQGAEAVGLRLAPPLGRAGALR